MAYNHFFDIFGYNIDTWGGLKKDKTLSSKGVFFKKPWKIILTDRQTDRRKDRQKRIINEAFIMKASHIVY